MHSEHPHRVPYSAPCSSRNTLKLVHRTSIEHLRRHRSPCFQKKWIGNTNTRVLPVSLFVGFPSYKWDIRKSTEEVRNNNIEKLITIICVMLFTQLRQCWWLLHSLRVHPRIYSERYLQSLYSRRSWLAMLTCDRISTQVIATNQPPPWAAYQLAWIKNCGNISQRG